MKDLENVSAMDIKIALIESEESESKPCISFLSDDGWEQIKEVTALRPQPKTYPSLKN